METTIRQLSMFHCDHISHVQNFVKILGRGPWPHVLQCPQVGLLNLVLDHSLNWRCNSCLFQLIGTNKVILLFEKNNKILHEVATSTRKRKYRTYNTSAHTISRIKIKQILCNFMGGKQQDKTNGTTHHTKVQEEEQDHSYNCKPPTCDLPPQTDPQFWYKTEPLDVDVFVWWVTTTCTWVVWLMDGSFIGWLVHISYGGGQIN